MRMSQHYNAIIQVFHTKAFVCVDGITKVELHDRLEVIIYDEIK